MVFLEGAFRFFRCDKIKIDRTLMHLGQNLPFNPDITQDREGSTLAELS